MRRAQLFITCLTDTFRPQIGEAMVSILRRLGIDVTFPAAQTCCGQPSFNAGLRAETRPLAEHMIRAFEKPAGPHANPEACAIVTPSGSCAHMFRHNYLELFADDPAWLERARALAARTYEFSEYLVDVLGVSDVGAHWDGALSYHPSCHLSRALNIDRQPRALLAHVRGAQIVDLPEAESCCGFGGVFSVAHPELSAEFLKRKIHNLEVSGAPTLVVAETGCIMHIAGGLHRQHKGQQVVHLAEVLANR
jgi:L-lactate dehydrogenase complex protein LldE